MAKKQAKHLADPTQLKPLNPKQGTLQVIIETPKGSRNKYAYDTDQKIFCLAKVLPAGMAFPYDFGFLPKTLAPDGDAIDVLLLMDEPAFPGCAVVSRLIGVIEGEQVDGKRRIRNDRLVAISRKPLISLLRESVVVGREPIGSVVLCGWSCHMQ